MARYSLFIIPILFLGYTSICSSDDKINHEEVKCINVKGILPMINPKGKVEFYDTTSYNIYYYKNMVMYQFPYGIQSFQKDRFIGESAICNRIIYRKGSLYGYNYDKHHVENNKKVLLDSALKNQGVHLDLSKLLRQDIVKLVYSEHDTLFNILKEIYIGNNSKEDATYKDSIYLYFTNKMNYADYTFSKALDSVKNLKLYKIVAVIGERFIKDKKNFMEKTGYSAELKEAVVTNPNEIIEWFDKFEKDRDKIPL